MKLDLILKLDTGKSKKPKGKLEPKSHWASFGIIAKCLTLWTLIKNIFSL